MIYAAYVVFEKLRSLQNELKSKKREEVEYEWALTGMLQEIDSRRSRIVHG